MVMLASVTGIRSKSKEEVEFKNDVKSKKVEVYIGSKFFTAYIFPDVMEKQSLYQINALAKEFNK